MKYRSAKNYGYGRSMKYAVKNALLDGYGRGHHETQRTHRGRLRFFLAFLQQMGVKDVRSIERAHLFVYADALLELMDDDRIGIHTAVNRLSSVNVLMKILTAGTFRPVSPAETIGRRRYVRSQEPLGLFPEQIQLTVADLLAADEIRLALLVALCRGIGARFREASLLTLSDARRQIKKHGTVIISRGSKGGRAKKVLREIAAPPALQDLMTSVAPKIQSSCLVPETMNYIKWYGWAHRNWRKRASDFGLSSKFHELRASFACERYERLTGLPAPCVTQPGAASLVRPPDEQLSDADARQLIAVEMGHSRVDVLATYCGGRK